MYAVENDISLPNDTVAAVEERRAEPERFETAGSMGALLTRTGCSRSRR